MNGYKTINVTTTRGVEFIDITREIKRIISEQQVKDGIALVYTPHTTAGITINENADPAVTEDITEFIRRKIPHEPYFGHMEGNSPAHIMSSLFSASETLIIDNGQLVLGTWQAIWFCEFDGPRTRKVLLKIITDSNVQENF